MLSGLGAGTHIYFVNTSALAGGVKKTPPPVIRRPLTRQEIFKRGSAPHPASSSGLTSNRLFRDHPQGLCWYRKKSGIFFILLLTNIKPIEYYRDYEISTSKIQRYSGHAGAILCLSV